MPRAKPTSIIEHRIALGKWERDQIGPAIQIGTLGTGLGMVAIGGAAVLAAYGLYWFFDAGWGIVQRIENAAEKYWDEAKKGNVLYLQPLEVPEDYNAEEDSWMRSVGDGTPLDHKWWASLIGL